MDGQENALLYKKKNEWEDAVWNFLLGGQPRQVLSITVPTSGDPRA